MARGETEPQTMSDLYASVNVTPNDIVQAPYEQIEVVGNRLMCPCMNEINLEDIRLGYHRACSRFIQIVLTRMVKDA